MYERLVATHLARERQWQPLDIILLRFSPSLVMARALTRLPVPKALELHGLEVVHTHAFSRLARAVDVVLVETDAMRDAVARELRGTGVHVALHVSPGTDTALFRPMPKAAARAKLGLAQDAVTLVCVSSFRQHHDLMTAIEATRTLRSRGIDSRLVLLGCGPKWQGVRRHIRDHGDQTFIDLPGVVSPERLALYVGAADACISLRSKENHREDNYLGFKTLEYVAAARPVIRSVNPLLPVQPWTRDVMFSVRPEDPEAVADAAKRVLGAAGSLEERLAAGREYVVAHHAWESVARSTLEQLRGVLGRELSGAA